MKRTILSVALLIGVLVSNTSVANNDMAIVKVAETELSVKAMAGLKFVLTASNLSEKAVVTIKDEKGEVLYWEVVRKQTAYIKKFDLSFLSDGAYSFVVTNGQEVIEKPFNIQTKRIASPKI
jgi:flagellar hook assembly protein FlgD